MQPGILLDRDGVLIEDRGFVGAVDRVEFIPGAAEAVASFNAAGIPVAVLTNQEGIAKGMYGFPDVHLVHRHIARHLAEHEAHIDMWVFCPYHPEGHVQSFKRHSDDIKPGPGMAHAAAIKLHLDLENSWVVGDRCSDMGMARAVGARAVRVGPSPDGCSDWNFPDLAAAAPFILERIHEPRPQHAGPDRQLH